MSASGIIDLASAGTVLDTAGRLERLLGAKGPKIFARIGSTDWNAHAMDFQF
jgi:hypothetical protein